MHSSQVARLNKQLEQHKSSLAAAQAECSQAHTEVARVLGQCPGRDPSEIMQLEAMVEQLEAYFVSNQVLLLLR